MLPIILIIDCGFLRALDELSEKHTRHVLRRNILLPSLGFAAYGAVRRIARGAVEQDEIDEQDEPLYQQIRDAVAKYSAQFQEKYTVYDMLRNKRFIKRRIKYWSNSRSYWEFKEIS